MNINHQLAAYSPVTAKACATSAIAAVGVVGDPRRELRELLLREYKATGVLLCGSGTQALQVAIEAAVLHMYSEAAASPSIALPAFSCFDVASAAIGAGVNVSLYDLDAETLAPDLASLERVIAGGAKVIVVAPLYGVPVDWSSVEAVADRCGVMLIEDAAQGHGAAWRGRKLGALGGISTLSFGRGKGWTGGNGGAVLVRGEAALALGELPKPGEAREVKTAVGLVAQWVLGRPSLYGIPRSIPWLHLGETTYHPPVHPKGMTRAAAAAVLANRRRSAAEAVVRRDKASSILAVVGSRSRVTPIRIVDGAAAGYLRLPLRLGGNGGRELGRSGREAGIERSYPIVLSELPELAERLTGPEREWPGAKTLVAELITVPTHRFVTPSNVHRLFK